jgi:hypothetical protein
MIRIWKKWVNNISCESFIFGYGKMKFNPVTAAFEPIHQWVIWPLQKIN